MKEELESKKEEVGESREELEREKGEVGLSKSKRWEVGE
jgi:hypothetical protein